MCWDTCSGAGGTQLFHLGFRVVDEAPAGNKVLHEGWERLRLKGPACRFVGDDARLEVNADAVSFAYVLHGFFAFQNGKPDIERIAEEDAGEGGGNNAGDAQIFDGERGVLAR